MVYELKYHSAIPGWVKVKGLNIKAVPKCEGGGFMIEEVQAVKLLEAYKHMEILNMADKTIREKLNILIANTCKECGAWYCKKKNCDGVPF